jgi:undecaprenyl pyrophosphate phosphatase UppP
MTRQPNRDRFSRWLGLMYATGFLLLVCGIPATVIISFVFTGVGVGLDRSQALIFGGCMIAAEIVIGGILLYVAERITKRRHRHDDADA